jgi:hypothetical protein
MAKLVTAKVQLEGIIFAFLSQDGSLTIESRSNGTLKKWSYREEVVLSPEGVKVLCDLLDTRGRTLRAAELGREPFNKHLPMPIDWAPVAVCSDCTDEFATDLHMCINCGKPNPVIESDSNPAQVR